MTRDELSAALRENLVDQVASKFRIWLFSLAPKIFGNAFVGGLVGIFVMPVVEWALKKAYDQIDLMGYFLFKSLQNAADAEAYQDSVRDTREANESGDADAIEKAKAEQRKRFARLALLSA